VNKVKPCGIMVCVQLLDCIGVMVTAECCLSFADGNSAIVSSLKLSQAIAYGLAPEVMLAICEWHL
jgi:hypothetical protein